MYVSLLHSACQSTSTCHKNAPAHSRWFKLCRKTEFHLGSPWHWDCAAERERRQHKRARMGRICHYSERECEQCGKCNFLDRATCRLCGKQRQEEDIVIARWRIRRASSRYTAGTELRTRRARQQAEAEAKASHRTSSTSSRRKCKADEKGANNNEKMARAESAEAHARWPGLRQVQLQSAAA